MALLKVRSFRRWAGLWLTLGLISGANSALRAQADLAAVREQAQKGVPGALTALGTAYASGQGVPQDDATALQCYRQAAAANDALAQYNLGLLYEMGHGVPQDLPGAVRFYLQAAKQGIVQAEFNLANLYADGRGVAPDLFEAALWYRQAAEKGLPEAQFNLGLAYELGRGVAKNPDQARTWYQAADAQGFAKAHERPASLAPGGRSAARVVQAVPVGPPIPDDRAAVLEAELAKVRLENARSLEALQNEKAALETRLQVAEAAMKNALSAPAALDLQRQASGPAATTPIQQGAQAVHDRALPAQRPVGRGAECAGGERGPPPLRRRLTAPGACRRAKNSRTRGSRATAPRAVARHRDKHLVPAVAKAERQARRRSSAAE